jgi:hypothetical protein
MVVIRYLAGITLMSALAAGCDQSLFDANPDNGRDGGPIDRIDASQPDARDGDDDPDAGPPPILDCPGVSNCVGDAVGEFAMNQDGPWRYVEVEPDANGFTEMRYDDQRDPPAWTGVDLNPSLIVNCDEHTEAQECAGLDQRVLLRPSADDLAPRPALAWTAPRTGTYRLQIDWRLDGNQANPKPAAVLIARNSRSDRVLSAAFEASTEVGTLPGDVEVDAVRGDSIALALAGNIPAALGVSFYVSDLARNDRCDMAFSFEGSSPFSNACNDTEQFAEVGSQLTVAASPPPGVPGVARTFALNSHLQYEGAINDYNRDWTLQFWARFDTPGDVLSDMSCTPGETGTVSGGISVKYVGDTVVIRVAEATQGEDYCTTPPQEVVLEPNELFDPAAWHFYRLVRDQQQSRVDVCVDDEFTGTLVIPSDATMATDRVLEIGNQTDTPESSFTGQIADLRMYDRALPCIPGGPVQ